MPNCVRIKPRASKTCIGDKKSYIVIKKKTKSAINTSAANPNITLTTIDSMWAMQKSVNGEEIFDGVNMIGKITDHFYIRYNPDLSINKTNIVEFDGNRYDIVEIIGNVEGKREETLLKCSLIGDSSLTSTKI